MSIVGNQFKNTSPLTSSAYIRIVSQIKQDRPYCYAILNWNRGKVSKSLGNYPYLSATPLLDVVILAAQRPDFLTDEELRRLLYTDKSYRPFAFQWAHYVAFLNTRHVPPLKHSTAVSSQQKLVSPPKAMLPLTPPQTATRKFHGLLKVGKLYVRQPRASVNSTATKLPAKIVTPVKRPSLLNRLWRWIGW